MGQTVTLWSMYGVSKAKTAKAVLFLNTETNQEAWMPLTVAQVKFIGKDYKVKVTVPGWFYNKIQWKAPSTFTPKAKPANPYIGADVGNMMEERMVLQEIADSETGDEKAKLLARIALIDEATKLAMA